MNSNQPATHNDPADGARTAPAPPSQSASKIQHSRPGIGQVAGGVSSAGSSAAASGRVADELRPLPMAEATAPAPIGAKISAFGKEAGRRHEESWSRSPNTTGSGAIHVKTFHCKLNDDALAYMDQMINEWLDAHPQYEVKFVSSTIGLITGKLKEPALICQVWV